MMVSVDVKHHDVDVKHYDVDVKHHDVDVKHHDVDVKHHDYLFTSLFSDKPKEASVDVRRKERSSTSCATAD